MGISYKKKKKGYSYFAMARLIKKEIMSKNKLLREWYLKKTMMKKEKKNGPLSKNDYYNNNDDNNFFKCFVLLRLGV